MWKAVLVLIVFTLELVSAQRGVPHIISEKVCKNKDNVRAIFEFGGRTLEDGPQYTLVVDYDFKQFFLVVLRFDTEDANITVIDGTPATLISNPKDRRFHAIFTGDSRDLRLYVKGTPFGSVPYPTSIQVNSVEICEDHLTGYIDEYATGKKTIPDESCGRRKFDHTELIVRGLQSKPGDWPWHAALFDVHGNKTSFICGGTLLSDTFILTAAHCVTSGVVTVPPETRKVALGKYNIFGEDTVAQEREVEEIIVHEDYDSSLNNDIALIKMKTPVVFTDYVQPACIWYTDTDKKLPQENINGTVTVPESSTICHDPLTLSIRYGGQCNSCWVINLTDADGCRLGFDQTDTLSSTLQQLTIPKQTETTCIKSNPLFFSRMLNNQKFCAGFANGTSACNGDSGGGFMVFVPDKLGNNTTGAWYVRGVVSLTVRRSDAPICDPNQFVIFTDVAEYRGWMFSEKTKFKMPS